MNYKTFITLNMFAFLSLDASSPIKQATRIISLTQLKKIAPLLPDCFQEILEIERGVVFTRIDSIIMNCENNQIDKIKEQLSSSDAEVREKADQKRRILLFDFEDVNTRLYFCKPPLEVKIPETLKSHETITWSYHKHTWAAILQRQQKLAALLESKDFEDDKPGKPELH